MIHKKKKKKRHTCAHITLYIYPLYLAYCHYYRTASQQLFIFIDNNMVILKTNNKQGENGQSYKGARAVAC